MVQYCHLYSLWKLANGNMWRWNHYELPKSVTKWFALFVSVAVHHCKLAHSMVNERMVKNIDHQVAEWLLLVSPPWYLMMHAAASTSIMSALLHKPSVHVILSLWVESVDDGGDNNSNKKGNTMIRSFAHGLVHCAWGGQRPDEALHKTCETSKLTS